MFVHKMGNFLFIPQVFKYKVKGHPRNGEKYETAAKKQLKLFKV